MKKIALILTLAVMAAMILGGCGASGDGNQGNSGDSSEGGENVVAEANEDFFIWMDNRAIDFSEEGKKQETIVVPARCTEFDGAHFCDVDVKYVSFEGTDNVDLGGAFANADRLISVKLPANQTTIKPYCFGDCDSLKEISIPATVEELGTYAFEGCNALETLTFEDGGPASIGDFCFQNCHQLKELVFPEGLIDIGENAFFNCKAMEKVTFSSSVKNIDFQAFGNCPVKEYHFPEGMESVNFNVGAFGVGAKDAVAYIVKDSWLDQNRDVLEEFNFGEIRFEDQ